MDEDTLKQDLEQAKAQIEVCLDALIERDHSHVYKVDELITESWPRLDILEQKLTELRHATASQYANLDEDVTRLADSMTKLAARVNGDQLPQRLVSLEKRTLELEQAVGIAKRVAQSAGVEPEGDAETFELAVCDNCNAIRERERYVHKVVAPCEACEDGVVDFVTVRYLRMAERKH